MQEELKRRHTWNNVLVVAAAICMITAATGALRIPELLYEDTTREFSLTVMFGGLFSALIVGVMGSRNAKRMVQISREYLTNSSES